MKRFVNEDVGNERGPYGKRFISEDVRMTKDVRYGEGGSTFPDGGGSTLCEFTSLG